MSRLLSPSRATAVTRWPTAGLRSSVHCLKSASLGCIASRSSSHIVCHASKENEGASSFDTPVAKVMDGLYNTQGYRIKFGVFKEKVETPEKMTFAEFMDSTKEEREAKQAAAAKELVNIDSEERGRRTKVGVATLIGTGALMVGLLAAGVSPSTRSVVSLPLFFGLGFVISGQTGL